MVGQTRVAVLGGDGRFRVGRLSGCRVRRYQSRRHGGNGELRRLEQSLKSGGVDRLIILARWNSHSVTARVMHLCRQRGIPIEIWS